eukprot:835718-Prorocentrum_minimum.AAC.1
MAVIWSDDGSDDGMERGMSREWLSANMCAILPGALPLAVFCPSAGAAPALRARPEFTHEGSHADRNNGETAMRSGGALTESMSTSGEGRPASPLRH